MTSGEPPRFSRRWYHPVAIGRSFFVRPKIIVAILAGVAAWFLIPADWAWSRAIRFAIAWDVGGLIYLLGTLRVLLTYDTARIRKRAASQDDSAVVILAVVLAAIASSFVAIGFVVVEVHTFAAENRLPCLALAILTIIISWSVTQAVFTLHYAHEYYAPPERHLDAAGGLIFPGDRAPDYGDFLYFAVSIGAASQTSDVSIRSPSLRRLVTVHAVVSFFFNTMVLALMVNMAASLLPDAH